MLHIILLLKLIFLSKSIVDDKLDGIYNIINIYYNLNFKINRSKFFLDAKDKSCFRIINIKNNLYYITTIFQRLKLGINNYDKIILEKINDENRLKFQWEIIKIGKKLNSIIIKNKYTNKFIEVRKGQIKFTSLLNKRNIFHFEKLCEEYKNKHNFEFSQKILKEPIDVIIKYIDLSDKTLNRTGINQTFKDNDNEELRYSLKSILQNIPWVRKIYILTILLNI